MFWGNMSKRVILPQKSEKVMRIQLKKIFTSFFFISKSGIEIGTHCVTPRNRVLQNTKSADLEAKVFCTV